MLGIKRSRWGQSSFNALHPTSGRIPGGIHNGELPPYSEPLQTSFAAGSPSRPWVSSAPAREYNVGVGNKLIGNVLVGHGRGGTAVIKETSLAVGVDANDKVVV